MYAKHGRTWAALHDPVGPRREWAELIRRFVEMAHAHNGRAAFYQVRADALPLYLDAGLTLMKLGEEAHVVLDDFDLKGSHRAHLRYALKRGERDGFDVEVIDSAACSRVHADPARDFRRVARQPRGARKELLGRGVHRRIPRRAVRVAGAPGRRAGGVRHVHDDRPEHRSHGRRDAPSCPTRRRTRWNICSRSSRCI